VGSSTPSASYTPSLEESRGSLSSSEGPDSPDPKRAEIVHVHVQDAAGEFGLVRFDADAESGGGVGGRLERKSGEVTPTGGSRRPRHIGSGTVVV
jgi:hypothetical protein